MPSAPAVMRMLPDTRHQGVRHYMALNCKGTDMKHLVAKYTFVVAGSLLGMHVLPSAAMEAPAGVVRASPATAPRLAPRILVKYRQDSAQLRDVAVANRSLVAAASRAGLDKAVPAAVGRAARGAIGAKLQRRAALARWSVVQASAPLAVTELATLVREIKADPSVESVELEQMFRADLATGRAAELIPNDPDYARYQWNLSDPRFGVHAPQAWAHSQGEGVVVAVVDTGIAIDNPDLKANVLPGYDMIESSFISRRPTDGRVPGGWDMGDREELDYCSDGISEGRPVVSPSSWHGSHVAGTIAQQTNNGVGVAVLAHKAKVLPVRVLGSCGGSSLDIVEGMLWAAGVEIPGLPVNPNPADVINMSLGGSGTCDGFFQDVIDRVTQLGTIVVVSAGNDDVPASQQAPASCNNVITVAATDERGIKANYSNHGGRVDISAPGGGSTQSSDGRTIGIWQMVNGGRSTVEPGNWKVVGYSGTSMASPHVAAAVAMIQSAVDTPLTLTEMRALLQQTASPLGAPVVGGRTMGAGILNIEAALIKATNLPCFPNCTVVATPLVNKVPVVVSGAAGEELLFRFQAEAGKLVTIMTYGGNGNLSLFASMDRVPTVESSDAHSVSATNAETVRFTPTAAGTYFIRVRGETAFTGASVVARQ